MDTPSTNVSVAEKDRILLACLAVVFAVWALVFIGRSSFVAIDGRRHFCLFDDAMISMRYAWNLSHGAGLVWNAGERVEGYSNLLMTLIMSLATLVFDKSRAVASIQIAGIGFSLAVAWLTVRIADRVLLPPADRRRSLVRCLAFVCALGYYPLQYWTLMGMETGLLALLLLLGVLHAFRYVEGEGAGPPYRMAGILGLAFLTRNDALIFSLLIGVYVLLETRRREGRWVLGRLLPAAGLFLAFPAGQLTFRRLYYGEWLPNTYTLKLVGMPLGERISNGAAFLAPFLVEISPLLALACLELILDFRRPKALLMSLFLSAALYQVWVGGDPWTYWRILSPTVPLLAIVFLDGVLALLRAASGSRAVTAYCFRNPLLPLRYLGDGLLVLLTLSGMALANARFTGEAAFRTLPFQVLNNWQNVNTALAIEGATAADASVGVLWGGAIPYYTGRRAVDFLGRCDTRIARLPPDLSGRAGWNGMSSVPGHNKYDLNHSLATLRPTYVQQFDWCSQDLSGWAANHYVTAYHQGVRLNLLRGSPSVLWSKVRVF